VAANDLVAPLTDTPERPRINVNFAVAAGNGFIGGLQRSGVGKDEAKQVTALVGDAIPLGELKSGAEADLTLGRRPAKGAPRPVDYLKFRARFDAFVEVARVAGKLVARKIPIAVDNTPLRIEGEVGGSLYRSARALGAPAKAIEQYLRTMGTRTSVSHMGSGARFEMIVDQRRAATGEVEVGQLHLASFKQGRTSLELMRWDKSGHSDWFDASGAGERKGAMNSPVNGARLTSTFGMRVHPILGTERMHKGLDLAAPYGSPIHASMDGVVAMAGRAGGYGNFVRLNHAGGLATGYGHMSKILVRPGQRVHRGDLIGLVGSTGLSTGPHVHFELTRNGVALNPAKMTFSTIERLAGADLQAFKAQFAALLATPLSGGARGGK
jgi:murein DD-endopeptidase MepM/ murein hydrolase activator NlpD